MLQHVVHLINKSKTSVKSGTLYCEDLLIDVTSNSAISYLEDNGLIENVDYENIVGNNVSLELSLPSLPRIGYFHTRDKLITTNPYEYPNDLFYLGDLKINSDKVGVMFLECYRAVISLIDSIEKISKHVYTELNKHIGIIINKDKALVIPISYTANQVDNLSSDLLKIEELAIVLSSVKTEKQLLYINELFDFLTPVTETVRFNTLLRNIADFTLKCENAYQFYLRDFSYNKLKIEVDSKALEFTQKIQAVINDSQTKLVTIPTAFVLVYAAFDFKNADLLKNIIAIISLLIFALLIQIFLNNQFSSLRFTESNIAAYESTFAQTDVVSISDKFKTVKEELIKQKCRLYLITTILWLIPAGLTILEIILSQ